MNKRYFIATAVVFIVWMLGGFVVHGWILQEEYAKLPEIFRPAEEADKRMHLMIAAHVMLAAAFTWIYSRGISKGPWLGQGVRYGVAIAFLGVIPTYTIYYVVQPTPGYLAVAQMVCDGILSVILGVVVAFLYRKQTA